eukprot:222714-Rhodomonas_salina.1
MSGPPCLRVSCLVFDFEEEEEGPSCSTLCCLSAAEPLPQAQRRTLRASAPLTRHSAPLVACSPRLRLEPHGLGEPVLQPTPSTLHQPLLRLSSLDLSC